jgi:hypothetical protein
MDLVKILHDSLLLLRDNPKAFAPRLFTTGLYSLYTLYSIWLAADIASAPSAATVIANLNSILLLIIVIPPLYIIDIISYAMYPRIVDDHLKGKRANLWLSFKEAVGQWRVVLAIAVLLIAFLILTTLIASFSLFMVKTSGNIFYAIFAAGILIFTILVFAILMFFVVPSAVLEKKGIFASFKESADLGYRHGFDLLRLNLIFLALVLLTVALAYISREDNLLSSFSIGLFFIVRAAEALLYTYISVTNPVAYLHVKR